MTGQNERRSVGLTVPVEGALSRHRDLFREVVDLGYDSVWSSESDGVDGFTPLVLAASWAPELTLGTMIIPIQTRGPAVIAQHAASLAQLAPGRFMLGLGASSPIVVNSFNSIPFEAPGPRTRDLVSILRGALNGETVNAELSTMTVSNFKLRMPLESAPPILLAGARPFMFDLATRIADGLIVSWVTADDVRAVRAHLDRTSDRHVPIVVRVLVAPCPDEALVRDRLRRMVAVYVAVPGYRGGHEWAGRAERLQGVFDAWDRGDRDLAAKRVPEGIIDELIIHGPPEKCRERIAEYLDAGADTAVIATFPIDESPTKMMRALAPASW